MNLVASVATMVKPKLILMQMKLTEPLVLLVLFMDLMSMFNSFVVVLMFTQYLKNTPNILLEATKTKLN